jgi:hypothetical protein
MRGATGPPKTSVAAADQPVDEAAGEVGSGDDAKISVAQHLMAGRNLKNPSECRNRDASPCQLSWVMAKDEKYTSNWRGAKRYRFDEEARRKQLARDSAANPSMVPITVCIAAFAASLAVYYFLYR